MFKKIKNKSLKIVAIFSVIILLATTFLIILSKVPEENEVEALSKYGSRGSEVTQIQTKLKRWGYYSGNVDGIYCSKTLAAVKWFQSKNGLTADGIAGKKTLEAMGIYTSSSITSGGSNTGNTNDVNLLSRLIYGESRGEPYTGQVAVRCSCFK